jgi:hypothetical protein
LTEGNKGYWETCPQCKQKYKSDNLKYVCPNCGHIGWSQIITYFVIGVICVFLFYFMVPSIPTITLRVTLSSLTALIGALSPIIGFIATIRAIFSKKPVPKEVPNNHSTTDLNPKANADRLVANPEHLAKWKEGTHPWNTWRNLNPDIRPNLRGADLTDSNMAGADLKDVNFTGATLTRADLNLAILLNTDLSYANLNQANLSFSVTNQMTNFQSANLHLANLSSAKLVMVDLSGADLKIANLSNANMNRAILQYANLSFSNLSGANLSQADCRNAIFSDVDLSTTNLRMAFYNQETIWPSAFNPIAAGAILES